MIISLLLCFDLQNEGADGKDLSKNVYIDSYHLFYDLHDTLCQANLPSLSFLKSILQWAWERMSMLNWKQQQKPSVGP